MTLTTLYIRRILKNFLLVLAVYKSDRSFHLRLRRGHQFPYGIEHLLELDASVSGKGIMLQGKGFRCLLQIIQSLCQFLAGSQHLTQTEVARRLGISQSAYAQQEAKEPVRKSTREKIAKALGIVPEQLAI